jgi:hypothetical protein
MGCGASVSHSSAITKTALKKLPEVSRLSSCLKDSRNNDTLEEEITAQLKHAREKIILKWQQREEFNFQKALIVMRPISSTALSALKPDVKENESDLSDVSLAAFGMFHSMILLRSNENDFLLDRCVEGIRLTALEDMGESFECLLKCFEHKQPVSLVIFGEYNIQLSSHDLAKWIQEESLFEYNFFKKNCIHFAWKFASKFTHDKNVTFTGFWETIRKQYWYLSERLQCRVPNPINGIEMQQN